MLIFFERTEKGQEALPAKLDSEEPRLRAWILWVHGSIQIYLKFGE
jgi:hypothetical protein